MRAIRLGLASAAFVAALALPAAAQTTTTMPPIPSIPITSATPTTAPSVASSGSARAPASDLASTGLAADKLVPLGFVLIGLGGALTGLSRRPRRAYALL